MITAIEIENFKGIGPRQRIELKPLTLLFGANSAGKSTLLHALHYAREVFERHNLDADQTIAGGRFVDLGGFRNFTHRGVARKSPTSGEPGARDDSGYGGAGDGSGTGVGTGYGAGLSDGSGYGNPFGRGDGSGGGHGNRPVRLRFELDLRSLDLPEYLPHRASSVGDDARHIEWSRVVESADVEVEIGWSHSDGHPLVTRYSVGINGKLLGVMECQPGRPEVELCQLNRRHPLFEPGFAAGEYCDSEQDSWLDSWLMAVMGDWPADDLRLPLANQDDALPRWGQMLHLEGIRAFSEGSSVGSQSADEATERGVETEFTLLTATLTQLLVGPGELVRHLLSGSRYVGPLRETPAREYAPPRFPDPSRWAGGLGAWDLLQTGPEELVDEVSYWLGDPERLNAGYELARKGVAEFDTADPLVRKLLSGRLFDEAEEGPMDLDRLVLRRRLVIRPMGGDLELRPHDIGIGISQVVPVVVTALDGQDKLIVIEQPELHLHPRLQAELGDLFIESALGERKHRVLLETHSELIPLRVMRRIRDSLEGQLPSHCPAINSNDIAIYYVCVVDGTSRFRQLELGDDGSMLDPWPGGFFEEGFRERFGNGGAVQ